MLAVALLALVFAVGCAVPTQAKRAVEHGIFDARGLELADHAIPLAGAWRVHWPSAPGFDGDMRVPSRIHEQPHPPVWNDGEGDVDFEIDLRNLPRDEPLALYVGRLFPTSTTCTTDEGLVVTGGRNGLDATHASSQLAPYVLVLPSADNLHCRLRLHVARERRGGRPGLWVAPRLGSARAVFRIFDQERIRDAAFTAMLLTLSGFFFFQWLLRRDERLALHVALFNAAAACWHTGFAHLLDAEPYVAAITRSRIEYAAIPLAAVFGFATALRIGPTALGRFERAAVLCGAVAAVALLGAPATSLHQVLHVVQPAVLVLAIAVFGLAVRALLGRGAKADTRIAAFGLLFPALCGVFDVVSSILTLGTSSTLGFGMFFLAVALALVLAYRNARARRSAELYSEATSRFVPKEFLNALGDRDVTEARLGQASQREVTILFADIRNFTSLSEALTPEETFRLLNDCFAYVGPPIREYGGFIDKYIGDAIMALFQGDRADAVRAAVAMHEALREANAADAFRTPIELGIGVHHGLVMMGTVGEVERFEATVIADAVNTTARIESLSKPLGCRILVSGEVAAQLVAEDRAYSRSLGSFALKGKSRSVELVEVFTADPIDLRAAKVRYRDRFSEAIHSMLHGETERAAAIFDDLAMRCPDDGPLQWWRVQAATELSEPASTVRSGAVVLKSKA